MKNFEKQDDLLKQMYTSLQMMAALLEKAKGAVITSASLNQTWSVCP